MSEVQYYKVVGSSPEIGATEIGSWQLEQGLEPFAHDRKQNTIEIGRWVCELINSGCTEIRVIPQSQLVPRYEPS